MTDTKLVAYVGRGLGSSPSTVLRSKAAVQWSRLGDGQVRALPADDAHDLMRSQPGQFALVDTLAEAAKRHSIKADRLAKLAEQGKLHTAIYRKRGEEPQVVVIQDDTTAAGIAAEHERATQAKEKE